MTATFSSIDGTVALVTGAASGIGRAVSARLAENGATVVGLDVSEEPGDGGPTFDDVVPDGELVTGDVSDPSDVDRAVDRAALRGPLSIVVNNAGIAGHGSLVDVDVDSWRRSFAVHVEGTYNVCRRALPAMVDAESGSIVNVSSVAGVGGYPRTADYAAAKGAITNLTSQLAVDYSPYGVRVNGVAPGFIKTAMNERIWKDPGGDEDADGPAPRITYERVTDRTLLPRLGEPGDVANLIAFLASDASDFITGQVVPVDGGWTAW